MFCRRSKSALASYMGCGRRTLELRRLENSELLLCNAQVLAEHGQPQTDGDGPPKHIATARAQDRRLPRDNPSVVDRAATNPSQPRFVAASRSLSSGLDSLVQFFELIEIVDCLLKPAWLLPSQLPSLGCRGSAARFMECVADAGQAQGLF